MPHNMLAMTDNLQPSVERKCRKCGVVKPFEDFAIIYAKNSRGQNYRQHICKECHKVVHAARQRRARKLNPELYRRIQKDARARNRPRVLEQVRQSGIRQKLRILNAYGGPICVCCKETCLTMLTMDHIFNDGAEHRKSVADLYVWLEANNYPAGFQVLCYNCNISKHRNGGVCEHLNEGSTTIPEGSSPQAIGGRSAGRPRKAV